MELRHKACIRGISRNALLSLTNVQIQHMEYKCLWLSNWLLIIDHPSRSYWKLAFFHGYLLLEILWRLGERRIRWEVWGATRWPEKGPKKLTDLPSVLCHSPVFILSCDTRVLQLLASSIVLSLCLDDDQHHLPDHIRALRGFTRISTWAYEWMLQGDRNRHLFYIHRLRIRQKSLVQHGLRFHSSHFHMRECPRDLFDEGDHKRAYLEIQKSPNCWLQKNLFKPHKWK
jgi:hypothetical protein